GDVDENCHISNIAYVRWVQEATRAHSEAIGWSKERFQSTGCFFLIKRHEIDYVSPAEGGDEITIYTWVEEFRPASAVRISHIMRGDKLLAKARTEWVWVTIEGGRPTRMRPDVTAAFYGAGQASAA